MLLFTSKLLLQCRLQLFFYICTCPFTYTHYTHMLYLYVHAAVIELRRGLNSQQHLYKTVFTHTHTTTYCINPASRTLHALALMRECVVCMKCLSPFTLENQHRYMIVNASSYASSISCAAALQVRQGAIHNATQCSQCCCKRSWSRY